MWQTHLENRKERRAAGQEPLGTPGRGTGARETHRPGPTHAAAATLSFPPEIPAGREEASVTACPEPSAGQSCPAEQPRQVCTPGCPRAAQTSCCQHPGPGPALSLPPGAAAGTSCGGTAWKRRRSCALGPALYTGSQRPQASCAVSLRGGRLRSRCRREGQPCRDLHTVTAARTCLSVFRGARPGRSRRAGWWLRRSGCLCAQRAQAARRARAPAGAGAGPAAPGPLPASRCPGQPQPRTHLSRSSHIPSPAPASGPARGRPAPP